MWDGLLDEPRAARTNPPRLGWPSIPRVRLLRPWHNYLRSKRLYLVFDHSPSRISRYSAIVRHSITCGLQQSHVRYLEGSVRENLRMPRLSVSLTRCGGCCSRVGASRLQSDLPPGSCSTTFAQLPSLGYHLRSYTIRLGELPVLPARRVRRIRKCSSWVLCVVYSDQ